MFADLIGTVLDDKYEIESELGKGGMGAVYLATHVGTERPVALKVIAPEFMKHDEFVERFRREARAAGRMRHPNIVDVTDFGFAPVGNDRVAYLVMEYLDGCTLAEVIAEEEKLPLSWVVDILEQTCSAVEEAHQNGIVHRDLKPDNIWLEPNHRGGYTVKVLDFGIAKLSEPAPSENGDGVAVEKVDSGEFRPAKSFLPGRDSLIVEREGETLMLARAGAGAGTATNEEAATMIAPPPAREDSDEAGTRILSVTTKDEKPQGMKTDAPNISRDRFGTSTDSNLTRVGSILGTPLYMSPEQCRGEFSDSRSDIYSLGVIAYQMLAGKTPFTGDFQEVMRAHREDDPPPLDHKRVPKRVAGVLMTALAKNPNERPSTAVGFASELKAFSEGGFSLLRRTLTVFSEHLGTFLGVAGFVYIPIIVATIISTLNNYFLSKHLVSRPVGALISVCIGLIQFGVTFFSVAVLIGVITRLVTQLIAAPLRPLNVRLAFNALRKRARRFFPTTMLLNILTLFGLILGILPGLYVLLNYSLVTSVMMMENVSGRAAMRRAKSLAKRSRRTVILILVIQFIVPVVVSATIGFLVAVVIKAFNPGSLKPTVFGPSYQIIFLPINIVLAAFSAVLTALLYLKMRQAGGETMKDALERFDEEEMPRTKWQMRMREKTRVTTRVGR